MSLYDEFEKEKKASSGTMYETFQAEKETKAPTSMYEQFKIDMADKPPVIAEPEKEGFLSRLSSYAKNIRIDDDIARVYRWPGEQVIKGFNYVTDKISDTAYFREAAEGLNMQYGNEDSLAEKVLKPASFGLTDPENIPLGVGQVIKEGKAYINDPVGPNVTAGDWLKGMFDTGKEVAKFPVNAALTVAGAPVGLVTGGEGGQFKFSIPGIGEFTNAQARVAEKVRNGEDWQMAALEETPNALFESLFFLGLAARASSPRPTTIAKTSVTAESGINVKNPVTSFRLYNEPVATQQLTPQFVEAMAKQKNIDLAKMKYDPNLPTYFKMTGESSGKITGEIIQIKPSYVETFINTLKRDASKVPSSETNILITGATDAKAIDTIKPVVVPKPTAPELTVKKTELVEKAKEVETRLVKESSPETAPKPAIVENKVTVSELPPEVQPQARSDWEENFAPEHTGISEQITGLEKQIKTVSSDQIPALQNQIAELSMVKTNLENAFIEKYQAKPAQTAQELSAINKEIADVDSGLAEIEAARALKNENNMNNMMRELKLEPSKARTEKEQIAEVTKLFDEKGLKKQVQEVSRKGVTETKLVRPAITSTEVKKLLDNNESFRKKPNLTVDANKDLTFSSDSSSFKIKPQAIGLQAENLQVGDVIRVNPLTMKGRVKPLRVYQGDEVLAKPTPIRGEGGKFKGSVAEKKLSVEELSNLADNSLSKKSTGMREKSVEYFKENPQDITAKPIRVREVEGKLTIEDGRHRLQAAKELGIDNIPVEDVTPLYPVSEGVAGVPSNILTRMNEGNLASTKDTSKTMRKILERKNAEKPTEPQQAPADFKVSERAKQIVEEFGVPIRERGISPRFLGLYKGKSKNIRVQALYDVTTVTHEAIHGIDSQINFSKKLIEATGENAAIRKQLTDIYEKLYPGGNKNHPLSTRIQEGLAVLFENYFYNPAETIAAYPELVNSFIKPSGEYYNSQFSKLLDRMNELVDDYARMTPEQRIGSRIRTGKEVIRKDTGFTPSQRAVFEVFNRFEPLKRYAQKAGVEETWDDPTVQAFNVLNKNSIVSEWVKGKTTPILQKDGNFKVEAGSVKQYLELIKGNEKEFYTYIVARRVHEANNSAKALQNELESQGIDPALSEELQKIKRTIEADDFSTQDAAVVVDKYAAKFAEAEKIYDDINNRLLDTMLENELIDAETAAAYKAEKGYASFKRYIEDDLSSVGTLQSSTKARVTSLKERKGSLLDLQSPVHSQITAINEIMGKAMENRLWLKVADLANKDAEIAQRFEKVDVTRAVDGQGNISYPQEKDPNVIRVFRDGQREFYKAAPEFLAVSKTLRGKEFDLFVQLMRVPASVFTRLTTSANPLFAISNATVDQFSALTQTKTGFKPILDPAKSLVALLKSDKGIQMYQAIGGKRQTLASYYDLSPDEVTHKLTGGETPVEKAVGIVDSAIGALELPSNISEIMTRYSEYARAVERGESMSLAMYRAAEVTTPFQLQGNLGGRFGQEYVKAIPYLNATLQVIYKFGRTARDNPTRVGTMYAALLATALTTAIAIMKAASDEQKRLLGEQPARNFSRYLYFPSPNGKDLIRLRIPEQFGAVTGMAYLYTIGNYGGNKATFNDYLDNVMSALPEQVNFTSWDNSKKAALSFVPQVLKPSVLTATNSKVFPEVGPIVPPYVVDKAPKEQYNTYTSKVSKTVADLLGTSPMLTDFWIKNQFGAVGSMLVGKKPTNPIFIEEEEYVMSGRSYTRFYDNKKLVTQQYDEIRKNNPDKYSDTDKERIKIEKGSYDKMSDALSDMRKISQTRDLPENVRSLAYDILLNIDTAEDQEEVRYQIGELKSLIADLIE